MVKDLNNLVRTQLEESLATKTRLLADSRLLEEITLVAQACIDTYKNGRKVMIAGNGGSAADAQHIAAEFVARFDFDRPGLPAIALSTDTSMLTAIANDYGYEHLFRRQVQANGAAGDLFIGISTSGRSKNVLAAIEECRKMGITTVALTGGNGHEMKCCDYCIMVPSERTPHIQEAHITIGHIICSAVEQTLFSRNS